MDSISRNEWHRAPVGRRGTSICRSKFVRFLAAASATVSALTGLTGICSSVRAAELAEAWQPIEEIAAAAERLVRELAGETDAMLVPEAGYIDPRLKLAMCTEDLATSLQNGSPVSGRATVQVECTGERPWKIFVPVQIKVTDQVLVASRSLASGHLMTIDDVQMEERDITRLRSGYIGRAEDLIGKRLKRQVPAGRVVTPAMLMERVVIQRGQTVTISANFGGVSIETAGRALMDGAMNERIQVENSGSQQVIEAIVRSPERVEVLVN